MSSRDELVTSAVSGRRANSKGWVRANCPFCELKTGKADKKQCLGLRVDVGKWHCFRCGSGGLLNASEDDLRDLGNMRPVKTAAEERIAIEPPEGFTPLFDGKEYSFPGDFMREYLTGKGYTADGDRKRELPEDVCRAAQIGAVFDGCGGACKENGDGVRCTRCKIRGRVVVPILDVDGSWRGWSARAMWKASRKYLYPPGMQRAEILYNPGALRVETNKPVYVVEGVFDVIALWPDAVALLGKASEEQRDMLKDAKRPVVVCLDGDAWREGRALRDWLRLKGRCAGFIRMSAGEDPDEVNRAVLDRFAAESLEG